MSPPAVTLLTLAAAALELGLAGYYFQAAFDSARLWLPYPWQQKTIAARFSLDRFLWRSAVPAAARRQYLMAHVFACVGLLCLAVPALVHGPLPGGLLFAGLTALALGDCWLCWRKYRRLL